MRLILPLSLFALAACGPLVQIGSKDGPPPALLRLSSTHDMAMPLVPPTGQILRIALPVVPAELRSQRIPVEKQPTQLQFLAEGQWVEPPAAQLQRLLLTRISARTGWLTVDERSADVVTHARLSGRLTAFGLDATQDRPRAHVRYEALLSQSDAAPRSRTFEIYVPLARQSATATATALNSASHQLADQLADWLITPTSASAEPAPQDNH